MKTNSQLTHAEHAPSHKKFPLSIIADNIQSANNIGSLFRLCDAMGIEKLYLCGSSATPPNSKINKTSRSTEKHVNFEWGINALELITQLKANGIFVVSLEITTSSLTINSEAFREIIKDQQSICLVLGSEKEGVDDKILGISDLTAHIIMHGNNSSMNVISAASIACYEITQHL